MVSRAAKHVFSRYLRKLPLLDVPSCVAHFLNCLIGYKFNPMPGVHLSSDDEFYLRSSQPQFVDLSVPRMRQEIGREIYKRFRYRLDPQWWDECRSIMLLREVCLKMGFQVKARDYLFEKTETIANCPGKTKKSTNGTNGHNVLETTFYPEDILNVIPIVKDAPLKVSSYSTVLIRRVGWPRKRWKRERQRYSKDKKNLVSISLTSHCLSTNKSMVYSIQTSLVAIRNYHSFTIN